MYIYIILLPSTTYPSPHFIPPLLHLQAPWHPSTRPTPALATASAGPTKEKRRSRLLAE